MTDMDDAYANGAYIAGADGYVVRWQASATAFRDALGARAELDVSYGPSPRQAYDFFYPEGAPQGTLIFVHGGYWRAFGRSTWSHFAAGALAQGWAVAMPSYDLCPQVRIAGITQQIAQAVTAIAARAAGPISLAGHSAGGHLVARMLAPGMLAGKVMERLHHVMPISGLSDLVPLTQTAMNDDFQMDEAMAKVESPQNQPKPNVPVTVWVGGNERPVFLDQTLWLANLWDCEEVIAQGRHHFDVIDDLADSDSDMIKRLTQGALSD